jgi:hypothetical protein
MDIIAVLSAIQAELKAPKNQTNTFGGYRYRSCEDILEGLKPLLAKHGAAILIRDEIEAVGSRVYIKATATLKIGDAEVSTCAYAREAESKKGMDDAQVTGSTSSYARKYALNGLFAIDDTKDADATNEHGKGQSAPQATAKKPAPARKTETPAPTDKPSPEKVAVLKDILNARPGLSHADILVDIGRMLKRPVQSSADITTEEARQNLAAVKGA